MHKLIFALFYFNCALILVESLACSASWECTSVSENFNYVNCVDNECRCQSEFGFIGDATVSSPCTCAGSVYWAEGTPYCKSCEAPKKIFYDNGIPYCVDLAQSELADEEEARRTIRKNVVTRVYENLLAPTPALIMAGLLPVNDLFDETFVKGRVTPVGTFEEFISVEEYFYALGLATPITNINIRSLTGSGDLVAVEVDITFNSTERMYNLTQMGFYTFNEKNLISTLDLVILNTGKALDVPPEAHPFVIQGICAQITGPTGFCPPSSDPEGYYTDFNDCVNFMSSIPFGSWNNAASNTTTCRQLHLVLTPFRPNVHCPHVGKLGGGKCIDVPYEDFYLKNF